MNGQKEFYTVATSDDRYASYKLTMLKDDVNVLPTNIAFGSVANYINPSTGDIKTYVLISTDGTQDNKVWKQIKNNTASSGVGYTKADGNSILNSSFNTNIDYFPNVTE